MDIEKENIRFKDGTEHIWKALDGIKRTGWVLWEIPDPETVAEHILAVKKLAISMRGELDLNDEEFSDLLDMIEIHDWSEVVTGDVVIMGDESDFIEKRKKKKETERVAMESICADLPEGEKIMSLYKRYEEGYDKVAELVNGLDKLQPVLLAVEYHKKYNKPGLIDEFVGYTRKLTNVPLVLEKLDQIEKEYLKD